MSQRRRLFCSIVVGLILVFALSFSLPSLSQSEEYDPSKSFREGCPTELNYCPERYDSLTANRDRYARGEVVHIELSDLRDFEYNITRVEVHHKPMFGRDTFRLFYAEDNPGPISREQQTWSWSWDQTKDDGTQVEPGRLYVRVKTQCCGNYRVYFQIRRTAEALEVPVLEPPEEEEEPEEPPVVEEPEEEVIQPPRAPANLSARTLSPTGVELNWSDRSDNEEGFRIYRDGEAIATVGAGTVRYRDTGLREGTSYNYRVSAFNEAGESSLSERIRVTTPVGVPSTPGGLSFERVSSTELRITWNDRVRNVEGFRIFRDGNEIAEVGPDTFSYLDTGLEPGRSYKYRVSAFNEAGESSLSPVLDATTPEEIPVAPGQLTLKPVSPHEIELRWEDRSDNEEGFRIYKNGNRIATVGAGNQRYTIGNLEGGTRYCYQVVAFNESGESGPTNRNCATTPIAVPNQPGNLRATALSPNEIELRWEDRSDNEEGFRVYRNTQRIATLAPGTTNYLDSGLRENSSYTYRVSAYNESGESDLSASETARTPRVREEVEVEEEEVPPREEEFIIDQGSLLAGIGIVVMVMGYIYSQMGS